MDVEGKKLAIRRLIEEAAAPRPEPASFVRHITVIGNHNIVADRVVLHDHAMSVESSPPRT